MKSNIFLILTIITKLWHFSNSENILGLFPHPGYSHFKVFYPILQELAKKGHNVTVVSYIKSTNTLPNYHELILKGEETKHLFSFDLFPEPSRSISTMFYEYYLLDWEGQRACKFFYESDVLPEILKKNKTNPFDLVILENFNTDCYLGIPYIFNTPVVALSSCALMPWYYDRFGLPDTPSFIPSEFVGFNENMNFQERFVNYVVTKGVSLLYRLNTQPNDNKFIKKYLNVDVNVANLAKMQSLMLVNQHYSLSGTRPLPSRVIEVGGVHLDHKENTKIPKAIENFLDKSKNGVIFISWGSMVKMSTLETNKVIAIVRALQKLPYDILWKWESDHLPDGNTKFMFTKWAPQKELLCHPKVRLFWSHGGLLGVSESVYCGKPLLVSPVYGDQFLNGKAVENRNMGIMLYHENLKNEEYISKAFKTILEPEYTRNAQYVSSVYRNRQNSPLHTAVWWIEHVIATKGNNLSYSPAIEMNGFVYHSLDVVCVLGIFTILIIAIQLLLCKFFCCKTTNKEQKQKKKVKFN